MSLNQIRKFSRFLSLLTWVFFTADTLAWGQLSLGLGGAYSRVETERGEWSSTASVSIPGEWGTIEKIYEGNSKFPLIYIQDAHNSLEAQKNISKLIRHFVTELDVKKVFVEGYEGEVPLDELYPFQDRAIKEKVSYFFMDYLRLSGAHYAYINRWTDFKLIGIESTEDYLRGLQAYKDAAANRRQIDRDLDQISKKIKPLADRYYPREIKEWLKLKDRLDQNKITLADYLFRSLKLQRSFAPAEKSAYPHLSLITAHLYKQELTEEEKQSFNLRLKELSTKVLADELAHFEKDFAGKFLLDPEIKKIFYYERGIALLRKLNALRLTPDDYQKLRQEYSDLNTREIAHFIARKLKRSVVLSDEWESALEKQKNFYELALNREKHFKKYLKQTDAPSILVTGGFHKNSMIQFLESRQISYILISPKITQADPVHRDRYDFLMSGQRHPFETSSRPETQTILQLTQPMQVRLGDASIPILIQAASQSIDPRTGEIHEKILPAKLVELVAASLGGIPLKAQEVRQRLQHAYQTIQPGETIDMGDASLLIYLPTGQLLSTFPLPNGQRLGKMWNFGAGTNLKSVRLKLRKEGKRLVFEFRYQKKGEEKFEKTPAIQYWDRKKLLAPGEELMQRMKAAYRALKTGNRKEADLGDVSVLIRLTQGRLTKNFPLPNGKRLGTARRTGAGENLKSVHLKIRKEGKKLMFEFYYQKKGRDEMEKTPALMCWDGKELLTVQEELEKKIKEAYRVLRKGKIREIDLGDVNLMIYLPQGTLKTSFPLPDGTKLEKTRHFGGGEHLKSVHLKIRREENRLVFAFRYRKEGKKEMEEAPAFMYWDGKELLTAQEDLMKRMKEAYQALRKGRLEEADLGDVSLLIYLPVGRLQWGFPLPNGKRLGKVKGFGAVGNLKSVHLKIRKEEGRLLFEFWYQRAGKEQMEKKPAIIYWDGKELLTVQEELIKRIKQTYRALEKKKVKEKDLGDVSLLIYMALGKLNWNFPLPNGNKLGKIMGFGAGKHLKAIHLKIRKVESGKWLFEFWYRKEGESDFREKPAVMVWNGKKLVRYTEDRNVLAVVDGAEADELFGAASLGEAEKQALIERIRSAYTSVQPGQTIDIGDVSLLIYLTHGQLQRTFLLPDGKKLGKLKSFGAVYNLKSVHLKIRREEGRLVLEFWYQKEGKEEMEKTPAIVYWDGKKLLTAQEELVKRMKKAYQVLKEGELKEVDLGDVSLLIQLTHGRLQMTFPLPDGKKHGKQKNFGAVGNLKLVHLKIRKEEGRLALEFWYRREGKEEMEKEPALMYWDGKELLTAQEELVKRMEGAYQVLKKGKRKEAALGDVSLLINLTGGQLQINFPLPDRKKLGKQKSFGASENLKTVHLKIRKAESGKWLFEFRYQKEGEPAFREKPAVMVWNGKKLIPYEEDRNVLAEVTGAEAAELFGAASSLGRPSKIVEALKRPLIEKIHQAYRSIKPGQTIDIGDVSLLIHLTLGQLQKSFPLPDRKKLGKLKSFGAVYNLKSIHLKIRKEEGRLALEFWYRREGKEEMEKAPAMVYWDGKELLTHQEALVKRMKKAYQALKQGKLKEADLGDVSLLIHLTDGQLQMTFPLPNGKKLGKQKSFGAGGNLKSVHLKIRKEERRLALEFWYRREQMEETPALVYWDGKKLLTAQEELVKRMKKAYQALKEGKLKEADLGDVSLLIQLTDGQLQKTFPLPDGKKLGKQKNFGAVGNLKLVHLKIRKEEGRLALEFWYRREGKEEMEETPAMVYWDGKELLTAHEALVKRMKKAYQALKEGKRKEADLGDVSLLIQLTAGQLQMSFPLPDGKKLGKEKSFGAVKNLKAVHLKIWKAESGKLLFEFWYQKEGEPEFREKPAVMVWNGRKLVPYTEDRNVLHEVTGAEADELFGAASLGGETDTFSTIVIASGRGAKPLRARRDPVGIATLTAFARNDGPKAAGASLGVKKITTDDGEEVHVTSMTQIPEKGIHVLLKAEADEKGYLVKVPQVDGEPRVRVPQKYWGAKNLFVIYRDRRLMRVYEGLYVDGTRWSAYPLVWQLIERPKLPRTPEEMKDFLEKQGLVGMVLLYRNRPNELKTILSIFLKDMFTLRELERLIWGFRKLNLEEVAMLHGYKPGEFDFVDIFLNTVIEKAGLIASLSEPEQEILIKLFLREIYKDFSKDPFKKIAALERKIGNTEDDFLMKLKERVREEFTEAATFQPAHIQTRLRPHESIGAYRLKQHDRFALLDGTRVGKTIQALAALDPAERTLVVSPAGVIDTWLEEERKHFSQDLDIEFVSADAKQKEIEASIRVMNENPDKYAVVVLRGDKANRRKILEAVRGRKRTLIHVSYETLREMDPEERKMLEEALDGIILDEWHYVENYVSGDRKLNAQQAAAIQTINPKKKWILSASPYRSEPHKLYALFHYLLKDTPDPPKWATNGYVFKYEFAKSVSGFRLLSGQLAMRSLRRGREDVWELYQKGKTPPGALAIPGVDQKDSKSVGRWTMPLRMAQHTLAIIRSFRGYIADVYNPAVPRGERKKQKDLNILQKLKFLRWLEVEPKKVAVDEESPFWNELDRLVQERLEDPANPEKKIVLYAQNTFMIEKMLERYAKYGVARIDGKVDGWARDERGEMIRDEHGRPVTAKNWERRKFQERPDVRIMVMNVRAGIGIDLSRADAIIYAQLPETYSELYQSMARAFGPNLPDHPREEVEVIFMSSAYPETLKQELRTEEDRRFVESGTVSGIHLGRLEAQQTRDEMILDGVAQNGRVTRNSILRRIPNIIHDTSLVDRELSPRQRIAVGMAGHLGSLHVVANAEQKRAIFDLIHEAYSTKEDLSPVSQTIAGIEGFDLDDLIHIASIRQVPNRYLRRQMYRAIPDLLKKFYEGGESLSESAEYYQSWNGYDLPDYVVMSGLASLYDLEDYRERMDLFISLAEEILHTENLNRKMAYQQLIAVLGLIRGVPLSYLELFREEQIPFRTRLSQLYQLAVISPFMNAPFTEIFPEVPKNFRSFQAEIKKKEFPILAAFFKKELAMDLSPGEVEALEEDALEAIYQMTLTLKRGRDESSNSKQKAKFQREFNRWKEILGHMLGGTYDAWRNGEIGERRHGARVEFLEENQPFWKIWTEELVTGLGEVRVTREDLENELRRELAAFVSELKQDPSLLASVEDVETLWLVREHQERKLTLSSLKDHKNRIGKIKRELFMGGKITGDDRDFLAREGLRVSEKNSELLDAIDAKLGHWNAAILWMELFELAATDRHVSQALKPLVERLGRRMKMIEAPELIREHLRRLRAMAHQAQEKSKRYEKVEIAVTSDPHLILRRGMLSSQLYNCFHLNNDPELVRALLDDLGSRNKMLVTVKVDGAYQAIAIAKIKTDREGLSGNPVIFLERILSRRREYSFEKEILEVLAKTKLARMNEALAQSGNGRARPKTLLLATMARPNHKAPVTLWSTGGYGEEEYSEPHFGLKKITYRKGTGAISNYQYPNQAQIVNASSLGRASKAVEALKRPLIERICSAYQSVKPGQTIDIGDVSLLIKLTGGQLQMSFPLPDRKKLGKEKSFGAGVDLKTVHLKIRKEEGRLALEFWYQKEGKEEMEKTPAIVYWNGKELLTAHEELVRRMRGAYRDLKKGKAKEVEIGDVSLLIQLTGGQLQMSFPLPDRKKLGKHKSFGAVMNLKTVHLKIRKEEERLVFEFWYQKEGKKEMEKTPAIVYWDGKKLLTAQEELVKRMKEAYQALQKGKLKAVDIGDVSLLIQLTLGQLQWSFPLSDRKKLGKLKSFGAGMNLKTVHLKIRKEEGRLALEFWYQKEGKKEMEKTPAIVYWNGKELLTAHEKLVKRIEEAYQDLEDGKLGEAELGDVSLLIQLTQGKLQMSFPLPNGKKLRKQKNFGAVMNLKTVHLKIRKAESGKWLFEFWYQKEGEPAFRERPAVMVWNGKKLVPYTEERNVLHEVTGAEAAELFGAASLGEREKQALIERIRSAYTSTKRGQTIDIGDVSLLIKLTGGQLQMSFPLPDRKKLGKEKSFGAGVDLKTVHLKIRKEEGRLALEFWYQKEGKEEMEKTPAIVYWDGKQLLTAHEELVRRMRGAYRDLKKGKAKEVEIGDVSLLIKLTDGQLQKSFPLPNGKKLGRRKTFGAGVDLKTVHLKIRREEGRLVLEFWYHREGKEEMEKTPALVYWDGKELLTAHEALVKRMEEAYRALKEGNLEEADLGDVSLLIYLRSGQLLSTFPLPNRKRLGKHKCFGAGENLKSVHLKLRKEAGRLVLEFWYVKEGKGEMEKTPALVYWDGKELLTAQEALVKKMKEAYQALKKGKLKEADLGDVSLLIRLTQGELQKTFPLPDEKKLEKLKSFGAGKNLKSVHLKLRKEGGRLVLEFWYRREGKEEMERTPAFVYWNGKELLTAHEELVRRMKEAYQALKKGKAKKADLGDVSLLIQLTQGKLQMSFPLPDGEKLEKLKSFGAAYNLKTVHLKIRKAESGKWLFEFWYQKEGEPAFRERPAVMVWNGKKLVPYTEERNVLHEVTGPEAAELFGAASSLGRHSKTVEALKRPLIEKIHQAYRSIKPGQTIDIGDVSLLIRLTQGQLQKSFPLPDGKKLGEKKSFGAAYNLKTVHLKIRKEKGRLVFEFWYQKEGKEEMEKAPAIVYWDGKKLLTAEEALVKRMKEAYQALKEGKLKEADLGDVSLLIQLTHGRLQMSFPLPDGKKLGKEKSFGAVKDLKTVHLKIRKVKSGKWLFEFWYRRKGKEEIEETPALMYWDREGLLTAKEELEKRIRGAYQAFKKGELKEADLGDVSLFIHLIHGEMQMTFPLPDRKRLGKLKRFGAGENLKSVHLKIRKEERRLVFEFWYQREGKEEMEKTPAIVYWDGKKLLTAEEALVKRMKEAYQALKEGKLEEADLGNVSLLIHLTEGQLQVNFPLPDGKKLGKQKSFGAVKNLKAVHLKIRKEKERLVYEFWYQKEGKEEMEKIPAIVYWDGKKLLTAHEELVKRMKVAYQALKEGKREEADLGAVNILINLTQGQLKMTFPLPDGKKLGKQKGFGAVYNLKSVHLKIRKAESGKWLFEFRYQKEGEPAFREKAAVMVWNGKRLVPYTEDRNVLHEVTGAEAAELFGAASLGEAEKQALIERIRSAYQSVKPGETIDLGDVSLLIDLTNGQLKRTFPLPDGEKLGKQKNFGAGRDLKTVHLKIRKEEGRFVLEFWYQKEGQEEMEKTPALVYLDGKELLTAHEELVKRIEKAYRALNDGKVKEIDLGDVSLLIDLTGGQLQKNFPLPDGRKLGKEKSFGAAVNLKSVHLKMRKEGEKLVFEFRYQKEGKKEIEETPAIVYWDGKELVTAYEELVKRMEAVYRVFEEGKADEIDLGDVSLLIYLAYGRLQMGFPLPNGKKLGERRKFGAGRDLKSVHLKIRKEEENLVFEFHFQKEGKKEMEKTPAIRYWDGKGLVTAQEELVRRMKESYRALKEGKAEEIDQGDVSLLIDMERGNLQWAFPLPDGKKLGESKGFGAVMNLKSVHLKIRKEESGKWLFEFRYQKAGETDFREKPAVMVWNGKRLVPYTEERNVLHEVTGAEAAELFGAASLGEAAQQYNRFSDQLFEVPSNPAPLIFDFHEWRTFGPEIQEEILKHLVEGRVKLLVTGVSRETEIPLEFIQESKRVHLIPGPLTAAQLRTLHGFLGRGKMLHLSENIPSPKEMIKDLEESEMRRFIFLQPRGREGLIAAALVFVSGLGLYEKAFRENDIGFWEPTGLGQVLIGLGRRLMSHEILARAA